MGRKVVKVVDAILLIVALGFIVWTIWNQRTTIQLLQSELSNLELHNEQQEEEYRGNLNEANANYERLEASYMELYAEHQELKNQPQ